jgi:hypothetical protein
MFSEVSEAQIAPPTEEVSPTEENTGSQWIPVEEETFEFEEKTPVELPEPTVAESMFGDSDFGAPDSTLSIPEVEIAPVAESEPVFEQPVALEVAPVVPVAAAALTEEQLREALAAASKDVIERIVWEVVPDLAEVLIKEAIRKIKEGQ